MNYRLKKEDVQYIFTHAEVDIIVVDREFVGLLEGFNEDIPRIVDDDTDTVVGDFNRVIAEGLDYDAKHGMGWEGLSMEAENEDGLIALAYTSGTTAKPKGVEYTHRGTYLAALANVIESGLNCTSAISKDRAKSVILSSRTCPILEDLLWTQLSRYLTILPLFHAVGWTFPWAVVSARGTHYCMSRLFTYYFNPRI